MGIFNFRKNGNSNDLINEMKEYIDELMRMYAVDYPEDMPNVAGIFANARIMINSMTPKDVKKGMVQHGVSAKCGALNILQNCAMVEIQSTSISDILYGGESDGGAFDLYMAINEMKFDIGYIDEEQYKDNKRLGKAIRMGRTPMI